jgi:tetratricopeptide (TPR) repeat protein
MYRHLARVELARLRPGEAAEAALARRELCAGQPDDLYAISSDLMRAWGVSRRYPATTPAAQAARWRYLEQALDVLQDAAAAGLRNLNRRERDPHMANLLDLVRWQRSINSAPTDVEKVRERAVLLTRIGLTQRARPDYERSAQLYSEVLAAAPDNSGVLKNRANAYLALGEYDRAAADSSKVLSKHGDDIGMLYCRAQAYGRLGRLAEAIADFTRLLELRPSEPMRYYRRSRTYELAGEPALAESDYRKLMELAADDAHALNLLAWHYLRTVEFAPSPRHALPLAERAVALDPHNYHLNTLGVVYYRLGNLELAVKYLRQAAAADQAGGTAFDHLFLAMALQRLGDPVQAQEHYDKALAWWLVQTDLSRTWLSELDEACAEAQALLGRTNGGS